VKMYYASRKYSKAMFVVAKLLGKKTTGISGGNKVTGYLFTGVLYITEEVPNE